MSKEDFIKLKGIATGATMNVPSSTIPKANGSANIGTENKYSRGDHVHPLQTNVSGNAGTATKLQTSRNINLTGAVIGSLRFDGSSDSSMNTTLSDIDASKITSGTIDIARLPKSALERIIIVSNDEARFQLTTNSVQNGDTIKVISTGKMYFIKDETKLSTEDGYEPYTAGIASEAASCTGNSATATKLQTPRTINGTLFDGTSNISTSNWGVSRNIKISDHDQTNTGEATSVNGSSDINLKLPSIFKGTLKGNADTSSSSIKATNDSDNQKITSTYIKDVIIEGQKIKITKGDDTEKINNSYITTLNNNTPNTWHKLGTFNTKTQGAGGEIWLFGGQGQNSATGQNMWAHLFIKKRLSRKYSIY